jgi:metal-responsive CopG/Arc/MetJ family transcriptional regulator
MQTVVDIPEDVIARLNRLSLQENTSRDQLLEQALVPFLEAREPKGQQSTDWRDYFGALKDFPEDAQAFQERVRSEWDRDIL